MPLLRTKEIRAMDAETIAKKLTELRDELMHERGVAAMGGAPPNPGKVRARRLRGVWRGDWSSARGSREEGPVNREGGEEGAEETGHAGLRAETGRLDRAGRRD